MGFRLNIQHLVIPPSGAKLASHSRRPGWQCAFCFTGAPTRLNIQLSHSKLQVFSTDAPKYYGFIRSALFYRSSVSHMRESIYLLRLMHSILINILLLATPAKSLIPADYFTTAGPHLFFLCYLMRGGVLPIKLCASDSSALLLETLDYSADLILLAFRISCCGESYLSRFTHLILRLCYLDLEVLCRPHPS